MCDAIYCKCDENSHCREMGKSRITMFKEVSLQAAMHQFTWNEITKRVFLKVGSKNSPIYSRITHFRPAGKGAVVSHSLGYGYSLMSLGDSVYVEMDTHEAQV
jgi:hypothetical protein